MPEVGEQTPIKPLYPVNPIRRPDRRGQPKQSEEQGRRQKIEPSDEENEKPHIDEYA